jgi:methionyl-tRNA formyltransferase
LRTIFLGSPEFAVTVLDRLLAADSPVEVVAVVTQPDKPAGRGKRLTPPPVKVLALERAIPVLQPVSPAAMRRPAFLEALRRFTPDLGIVAAYGRILRADVLSVPRLGHLNVHASVLPRWRGAWPVGAAILAGDGETGTSIMLLDEGMDTGPVLATRREAIRPDDITGTLEARLATLGAALLVETIPAYAGGTITPQPQDDRQATYCRPVGRDDAILDWSRPAVELERRVRAMQPQPVAWTTWMGRQLRVLAARTTETPVPSGTPPGTVVPLGKQAAVVTAEGPLVLERVQLEGKNPVAIGAFLNGYRAFLGSRLGA